MLGRNAVTGAQIAEGGAASCGMEVIELPLLLISAANGRGDACDVGEEADGGNTAEFDAM